MSDWYVSRINVREGNKAAGEPGLIAEERVLTIKAPYAAAKRSYEVFKSLGIPDVGLYEWSKNKKSYAASLKSQKRRKSKKLTKADLAPALMELAKEDKAREKEVSDSQEG
tara:strand:- start:7398 stop:7730 length:333 start_codon:yes stop_codon:yes gene_type:complete